MKKLAILLFIITLTSCKQPTNEIAKLQNQIDSLKKELNSTYKPGFGDLMSGVQNHHSKLWFAGVNENWELANFEVHEINELLNNVKKYQSERKETESLDMINPLLDSVSMAIKNENLNSFKKSYKLLTITCNECHKITEFKFNIVKVPTRQVFSNQEFKIKQ